MAILPANLAWLPTVYGFNIGEKDWRFLQQAAKLIVYGNNVLWISWLTDTLKSYYEYHTQSTPTKSTKATAKPFIGINFHSILSGHVGKQRQKDIMQRDHCLPNKPGKNLYSSYFMRRTEKILYKNVNFNSLFYSAGDVWFHRCFPTPSKRMERETVRRCFSWRILQPHKNYLHWINH